MFLCLFACQQILLAGALPPRARTVFAYTYNAVGNRLTQNDNGTTTNYAYDAANRLTSVNGVAYTWDNNGNLRNDGARTFTYNQANRLKTAAQGTNNYVYTYNGVGDRVRQTANGVTTNYALDLNAGLTQVLSDGNSAYLYGNGRIAQYQTAMQYFGADALGSVRQLYNASGQVIANARYDPYGNVLAQSGAASAYGFTGEERDATGLTFLRARYYDSQVGRFTSRDEWEGNYNSPLTLNRWNYVQGNPVNITDPSGHCFGIAITSEINDALLGGILNPLNAPRNYEVALKAWEKCSENLGKAKAAADRGDPVAAMAYAAGVETMAQEGQVWIQGWNKNVELVAESKFTRWYLEEPYTWYFRLRPDDLPDLMEYGKAQCNIWGTGFTIASFLTPGVFAVKGAVSRALATPKVGAPPIEPPEVFIPRTRPDFYVTPGGVALPRSLLERQGTSPRLLDFTGLEGAPAEEWVARIPRNFKYGAQLDEGTSQGFRWISPETVKGRPLWEIRIHSRNTSPSTPPDSPAGMGWTVRIGKYVGEKYPGADPLGYVYLDVHGNIVPFNVDAGHTPLAGNPYLIK